jgi:mannosyltransferase
MQESTLPEPRVSPGSLALAALLLLGLVLRLSHLGSGLWYDEIQTLVEFARLPLGRLLTEYPNTNHHPLYSLLASVSIGVLGESGAALRLPAALMGTASLWAFYRFAIMTTSRREALLGTLLLTLSYHHVWFSQNARGYSGLLLLTLLGTAAFLRLLRDPRAGWPAAAWYGGCMALAAYIHPTAVAVPAAHAIVLGALALSRRKPGSPGLMRPLSGLLLAGGFGLLLYAPMLGQLIAALTAANPQGAETAWKSPAWMLFETARGLSAGLPGGGVTLVLATVVLAAGVVSFFRRSPVLLALLLGPGLVTAAAILLLRHNLWPRFFFFSAGFAVLIALRGGFTLAGILFRGRGEAFATAGAVLAALAGAVLLPRAWAPKQDFEAAARMVERSRGPNDAVVTVDLTVLPYRNWLGKDWAVVTDAGGLEAIERTHRRTWLLYTFPVRLAVVQPGIWQVLSDRYRRAAEFPGSLGGGTIVVMVTPSNSTSAQRHP